MRFGMQHVSLSNANDFNAFEKCLLNLCLNPYNLIDLNLNDEIIYVRLTGRVRFKRIFKIKDK